VAALREFFTLAPAWMRAVTAMAALAVCVMVVFTVVHFSEPKTVVQVVAPAPTQAQVDALVRQRAEELRGKEKQEAVATVPEKQSVAVVKNQGAAGRAKAKRATVSSIAGQEQIRETPGKVKASQAAREQLAELVQTSKDDDGLPRLSDLIDDSNEAH
jgi:hypothetical protein